MRDRPPELPSLDEVPEDEPTLVVPEPSRRRERPTIPIGYHFLPNQSLERVILKKRG